MTNPVTKYELRDFAPEDIAKLMENFFDIVSWAQYEVAHTHHFQSKTFDVGTLAAGASVDFTSQSWPDAFPVGVTPIVALGIWSAASAAPSGISKCVAGAWDVTNTGFSLRISNIGSGALGAGINCTITGIDSTFNTSLA